MTALQAAIVARLAADGPLVGLLGGPRIHDAPPRVAALPYVAFGPWTVRRLDASEAPADEHRFEIRVVSREGGRREAAGIAARIRTVLDEMPPVPAGGRLANLAAVSETIAEGRDRRSFEAVVTFRALVEPA
jgi:hypothetical protein